MKNLILENIQRALNCYLALDAETPNRLKKLSGKVVSLQLTGIDMSFHLFFEKDSVKVEYGKDFLADTVIKGTPLRLLQMSLSKNSHQQTLTDILPNQFQGDQITQ